MILDYDRHLPFGCYKSYASVFCRKREFFIHDGGDQYFICGKKIIQFIDTFPWVPVKLDPVFFTLLLKVSVNFARLCLIAILLHLDDGKLVFWILDGSRFPAGKK